MFAEDLGQLPGHGFTRIVEELLGAPRRSSADELGRLFELLDDPSPKRPEHGLYAGVPYANGGLFARPARLHLERDELELLRAASGFNWRAVEPQIFGSLLEGTLGHDKQWELGAHYTHDAEMQKIVQPTIVRPWRERIGNVSSLAAARRAQADLMSYVVLDPACGSGNFLYLAYRELRRIERLLQEREAELRRAAGLSDAPRLNVFFPLQNIRGMEIDPFAVALARVTLWMGHRLAVEELALDERTLPLVDLSGIANADALSEPWPRANAIIGNPPYHGSQNLRAVLGDQRVQWLSERFGCGVQDLCVYWFRRAADHMQPGARAGLVGTNSISQNRARAASLNYVVEHGGVITDAISRQKWPGEAVVNVSIVNWVAQPDEPPAAFALDGAPVAGVSTRLRESKLAVEEYEVLEANLGRSFQGPIPGGDFYLRDGEAEELLASSDPSYEEVVRPYLVGDDITDDPEPAPRRHVIDFADRPLEVARRFPAALALVRERVKPGRDDNNRKGAPRTVVALGRGGRRHASRAGAAGPLRRRQRARQTVSVRLAAARDLPKQPHQRLRVRRRLRDRHPDRRPPSDMGALGVLDAAHRPALHPHHLLRDVPLAKSDAPPARTDRQCRGPAHRLTTGDHELRAHRPHGVLQRRRRRCVAPHRRPPPPARRGRSRQLWLASGAARRLAGAEAAAGGAPRCDSGGGDRLRAVPRGAVRTCRGLMAPHPDDPGKPWTMDAAEQRFDELLRCAVEDGPQFIEREGVEVVVVVAADQYRPRKPERTSTEP